MKRPIKKEFFIYELPIMLALMIGSVSYLVWDYSNFKEQKFQDVNQTKIITQNK
jgi:hypothetical protein